MSVSTTIATVIPLTTTFTPSPSCLSDYYWISNAFISLGPASTSDCLPSGWQVTSQYFSPGVCPSGYMIACSTTNTIGSLTETQATCCPSSYSCDVNSNLFWASTEPCLRLSNAFPTTSTLSITTIVSGVTTISPSVLTFGGVNAYGITIWWQSSDFPTTTTHPPATTLTPIITTTITLITNETISHSLTPGAAAGIGVGATLIFVAIIAVVSLFTLQRRWRSKLEPMSSLRREPDKNRPQELENSRAQHELHGENEMQVITMDDRMVYSAEGSERRFVELPGQGQSFRS